MTTQSSSSSSVPSAGSQTDAVAIGLPDGCRCSVRYETESGKPYFYWTYALDCPVSLRDHPMYCHDFGLAWEAGVGFASASGHGFVRFGDGKVG